MCEKNTLETSCSICGKLYDTKISYKLCEQAKSKPELRAGACPTGIKLKIQKRVCGTCGQKCWKIFSK